MKKVVKDMIIVFVTILVIVAIASYWYWKSDNAVGPNLITAFVGVAISALVTLVLLNGQTKEEEKKDRNLNLYNAKLKVYSNFVSSWYKALSDNQITPGELRDLRTMLFGKVFFYVNKTVLEIIEKKLKLIIEKNENIDANDSKMQDFFIKIVSLLQKDLNGEPIIPPKSPQTKRKLACGEHGAGKSDFSASGRFRYNLKYCFPLSDNQEQDLQFCFHSRFRNMFLRLLFLL